MILFGIKRAFDSLKLPALELYWVDHIIASGEDGATPRGHRLRIGRVNECLRGLRTAYFYFDLLFVALPRRGRNGRTSLQKKFQQLLYRADRAPLILWFLNTSST